MSLSKIFIYFFCIYRAKVYAAEILGGSGSDSGSVMSGVDTRAEEEEKNRLRQQIRQVANVTLGKPLSHKLHYI